MITFKAPKVRVSVLVTRKIENTLKEETFSGRNFRGFAVFSQIRERLFPRNISKDVIRESLFPRNFPKVVESLFLSSSANILKKIHFCSYSFTTVILAQKWMFGVQITRCILLKFLYFYIRTTKKSLQIWIFAFFYCPEIF